MFLVLYVYLCVVISACGVVFDIFIMVCCDGDDYDDEVCDFCWDGGDVVVVVCFVVFVYDGEEDMRVIVVSGGVGVVYDVYVYV